MEKIIEKISLYFKKNKIHPKVMAYSNLFRIWPIKIEVFLNLFNKNLGNHLNYSNKGPQ